MDRLPDELLNAVFFHLHQEDKVEFMTVCQHWKEIIETSSLFHTVRVSSVDGLDRVTKKLSNEPDQAARVERLFIDVDCDNDVCEPDLDDLLFLLPNLGTFSIVNGNTELNFDYESAYPFHKSIERVTEFTCYSILKSVLQNNICPNLTTLSYCQNGNENIYALLKNAPQLKTLDVYYGIMNLMHFETIHENAPRLTTLSVNMITVEDTVINYKVTPAFLITRLTISRLARIASLETTGLLPYISKKYPSLKHLAYDVSMENRPGMNDCLDTLLHTINSNLKSLSITSYSSPKKPCRFLKDGAWYNLPLEQKISVPPSSPMGQSVFSDAIHMIQSLTLLNITTDTFDGLKNFTSLKELILTFETKKRKSQKSGKEVKDKQKIEFQAVLDACPPSLKSLSLECVEIEPTLPNTNPYLIESLSFDEVDLPLQMDAFISQHFPKLSTLLLKGPELKGREFVLPNMNLFRFQFGKYDLYDSDSILVSTLNNNNKRRYTLMNRSDHLRIYSPEVDDFDDPIYLPVKSSPESNNGTDPYFTLVCNSVIHVDLKPKLYKYIQYLQQ